MSNLIASTYFKVISGKSEEENEVNKLSTVLVTSSQGQGNW